MGGEAAQRPARRGGLGVLGAGTGHRDDPLALGLGDPAGTPAPVLRAERVKPPVLKSAITLCTWLSSVCHMAAIWGTECRVAEARRIPARWRVEKCLALLA
jgi:hypothetical protein